jgi:manganese/zinc/iron transport system permease protein
MDFGRLLHDLIFDYTLRNVALGAAILGVVSGVLGSFALLRRQSLLGDTLSHAALPGICLAFILSGQSKAPAVLLLGAAAAGWIAALLLTVTVRHTRIKEDAAMGVMLSVFFGTGYVLLSLMQRWAGSGQAGLAKYLFGSAASLVENDVWTMSLLAVIALGITALLYKEFKLLAFDQTFLATLGYPVRFLDVLLISLIVIAIVIGLQTVGVVLMSAMLIAPGAAARQWTNRLGRMIVIATAIGVTSGVLGAVASALAEDIPTGPMIVVMLSAATFFSFIFGSERGMLWAWLRRQRTRANVRLDTVLGDMLHVAERHANPAYAVPAGMIRGGSAGGVLRRLAQQGLVRAESDAVWVLTPEGYRRALEITHNHRTDEADRADHSTHTASLKA